MSFYRGAFVQAHTDSEDCDDAELATRSVTPASERFTRRSLVAGLSIAGLCMAAAFSFGLPLRKPLEPVRSRSGFSNLASGEALFGKPGEQCGGEGFQGNTCCQAGCACLYKDQSYSECRPPMGLTHCSVEAAKLQLEVTNSNLARVKENVAATAKLGAVFQATAMNSHDGFVKADKAQEDAFQYGLAKRIVWQANKDKKADALLAVDKAQDNVVSLTKRNKTLVDELTALQKASFDSGQKPPQCSALYGTCNPTQGCCSGCVCLQKAGSTYQCMAPGAEQACDVATAQAKVQVKVAEVQGLGDRLRAARADVQEKRTVAQQATAASASAFKEAAAAGALREDAVEAAARAQMDSEIEERQAKKARELAKRAYEAEEIGQAVAAAWEKASAGNAC